MKLRLYFSLIILGLVIGCTHTQKEIPPPLCYSSDTSNTATFNPVEPAIYLSYENPKIIRTEAVEIETPEEESADAQGSPLDKNRKHDIDFEMNSRIQWWIKRYTGPDRKYFRQTLASFDTIRPVIEKIFEKNGIPKDLTYLCMVESGGRPNAVSRSGATGYWQFTADTAKNYKLTVNNWVDERRDLVKSTNAAARYLKNLYAIFNDWLLAGAAYNAGEGNIYRVMKAYPEIDTFWDISYHTPIKRETLDYIPKLIATIVLAKNRAYYGLNESNNEKNSSLAYETVRVPNKTYLNDIADLLGVPNKQIALLNADLVKQVTPPSGNGHDLKVPKGTAEKVAEYVESIKNRKQSKPVPDSEPDEEDRTGTDSAATYTVKKGDTLYRIAKNNSLSVSELRAANALKEDEDITIGQVLTIPGKAPKESKKEKASEKKRTHKVAKGDTLKGISREYSVSIRDIMEANGLEDSEKITPGQVLTIPEEASKEKKEGEKKEEASPKKRTHTVARGDTLRDISRKYGVSIEDIIKANDLKNAKDIHPKMVLNIPARSADKPSPKKIQYTVKKGDTMWSIARRFEVDPHDIVKWNNLESDTGIHPGDELTIRK
jgi:membrane-bound lytic murein transglycosylase D